MIREHKGIDPRTGVVRVVSTKRVYPDHPALNYLVAAYLEDGTEWRHYWFNEQAFADRQFENLVKEHFPEQFEWQEAHLETPPVHDQYSDVLLLLHKRTGEFCTGYFYEWGPGEILDLIQTGRDGYRLHRQDYYWKALPDGKALLKLIRGQS